MPERVAAEDPYIIAKGFVGPAGYLLGAAAAWLNVYVAFTVYWVTPLFFITPPARKPGRLGKPQRPTH